LIIKTSFFDKIEDVTIVNMFKQVFQWRNSKLPDSAYSGCKLTH